MKDMVYTNDYFQAKILDLRLALRRLEDFHPIQGISEKIPFTPVKSTIKKPSKVLEK